MNDTLVYIVVGVLVVIGACAFLYVNTSLKFLFDRLEKLLKDKLGEETAERLIGFIASTIKDAELEFNAYLDDPTGEKRHAYVKDSTLKFLNKLGVKGVEPKHIDFAIELFVKIMQLNKGENPTNH